MAATRPWRPHLLHYQAPSGRGGVQHDPHRPVNGTNADDLTRAEIEGRRQMMSMVRMVREYIPGFENAFLARGAAHVGIRETRRIAGRYTFCARDVIEARKFADAICRLAYPGGCPLGQRRGLYQGPGIAMGPRSRPPGLVRDPLSLPAAGRTAECAGRGRCVSSTQAGHGAIRIMPRAWQWVKPPARPRQCRWIRAGHPRISMFPRLSSV